MVSRGRSLAWFRTSACHVDDPGSNPGDRTKEPFSLEKASPKTRFGLLRVSRARIACMRLFSQSFDTFMPNAWALARMSGSIVIETFDFIAGPGRLYV